MSSFTFERQGANAFLVYAVEEGNPLDTLSLGMLTNNRIDGLLPVIYTQIDNTRFLKYNISSKITLQQYFQGIVNKKQFLGVFRSITGAMLAAEEYMIVPGSLLLDMNCIYVDVSCSHAELICLPLLDEAVGVDIGSFFKNIMFTTRFEQNENCDYVMGIINYLNSTTNFSPLEFKALLDQLLEESQRKQNSQEIKPAPQSEPRKEDKQPSQVQQSNPRPQLEPIPQPAPVPRPGVVPGPSYAAGNVDGNRMQIPSGQQRVIQEQGETAPSSGKNEKKGRLWPFGRKKKKEIPQSGQEPAINRTPQIQQAGLGGMKIPGQKQELAKAMQDVARPIGVPLPSQPLNPQPIRTENPLLQNFGETVMWGETGGENTTTLYMERGQALVKPYLIRKKNNEKIPIEKDNFRLGRDVSFNDYSMDNPYVGHCHCHIISKEGEYFVVDDNSKNHTLVNGAVVQPGSEVKLSHGQIIRLADEEFEFRLY